MLLEFRQYLNKNDFDSAESLFQKKQSAFENFSVNDKISILNMLGILASRTFHEEDALKYYMDALKLVAQTDDAQQLCTLVENIAAIYVRLGDSDKAAPYLQLAELLYQKQGKSSPVSLLNSYGTNEFYKENYAKAIKHHEAAVEILRHKYKDKISTEYQTVVYNLAWDYLAENRKEDALNLLLALQSPESENYDLKARILYVKALQKDTPQIREEAAELLKQNISFQTKAFVHLALAECARNAQQWESVAEQLILSFDADATKTFIHEPTGTLPPQYKSLQRRYLLIADALCHAGQTESAWMWIQRANFCAERQLLSQSSQDQTVKKLQHTEGKLISFYEKNGHDDLPNDELLKDRIALEHNYEDAKKALRETNHALWESLFSERINVHPDDLDQIRYRLAPDTILLEIAILDSQIAIFVCSHQKPVVLKTYPLKGGSKSVKNLILQYRAEMFSPGGKSKAKRIGKKLYDILISPVSSEIESLSPKTILFSPAGILRYVSLATLYDGEKYLIEKYEIANLCGYDLMRLGIQEHIDKSNICFVAFANPDGSLPGSDKECAEIAYKFSDKKVFSQHNATVKNFYSLSGNATFVHIATHGVLNAEHPEDSFLIFADEKLRYKDMIAGIPMMDHLGMLVLSACNTASANPASMNKNALEIYGMAYQFVRKTNSGATIATLWQVSDEHTQKIMNTMYEKLLYNAQNYGQWHRIQCLTSAQRKILAQPETEHPFYWGAFILIGNYL